MPQVKKPINLKEVSNSVISWTHNGDCYEYELFYKKFNANGDAISGWICAKFLEPSVRKFSFVMHTYGATAQAKVVAIGKGHGDRAESEPIWIGKKLKINQNAKVISEIQDIQSHARQMKTFHGDMAIRATRENRPHGEREHLEAHDSFDQINNRCNILIAQLKDGKIPWPGNDSLLDDYQTIAKEESAQAMKSDLVFPSPPENKWTEDGDGRFLPARAWANRNRNAPILNVCEVLPQKNSFVSIPWQTQSKTYELSWKMRGSHGWKCMTKLNWTELGKSVVNRELLIQVIPSDGLGDEDVIGFDIPPIGGEYTDNLKVVEPGERQLEQWIDSVSDIALANYLGKILNEKRKESNHHEH